MTVESLVSEALELSPAEKAELIESIARSLEPARKDEAWGAEAERRIDAVDSGDLETVAATDALASGRNALKA